MEMTPNCMLLMMLEDGPKYGLYSTKDTDNVGMA